MSYIQTHSSTIRVLIALPQEKHNELVNQDNIRYWLSCYNLKARVRGLEDRSRLDDQSVRRLPKLFIKPFILQ